MITTIARQTGLAPDRVHAVLYEAAVHYRDFLKTNDQWHLGRHTGLIRSLVMLGADNPTVVDACSKIKVID